MRQHPGAMRYTNEELSALLQEELRKAVGAPDSEIAGLRLRNKQFYKAEAVGELSPPEMPDRSQVVATDVPDTVEWMLPSLMRTFVQSKDAMECKPRHPRYAAGAKLAAEYLRFLFWERNPGFLILHSLIKTALIEKVGFAKVYWCDEPEIVTSQFSGLSAEQANQILSEQGTEALEQAMRQEVVGGQPIEVYDIKVKRTLSLGRVKVETVPPEEMRLHRRAKYDSDPLFVAHVSSQTRAELEAEGYDLSNVTAGSVTMSQEAIDRAQTQTRMWMDDSAGEFERFDVSECYIQLDQDNDGQPEWRRVLMVGTTVMEDEPCDGHPFVWFCPNPDPHVFFGSCPADHAVEPQKLGTSLLRGLMDSVYLSVNTRNQVLDGKVNLDDMMSGRPGGFVRVREMGAVQPLQQPEVSQGAWQMVEWTEQWRERRTGYTRFSQGLSGDALNPTATGASLAVEKGDQRIELMARVAAEALTKLFSKIVACAGKYQKQADLVPLFGQFVFVDPREWCDGFAISIDVGLGTGGKDRKALALDKVHQMQAPLVQAGMLPPQAAVASGRAFVDAVGLADPASFFPDPPPPQPPQTPLPLQIEQAKLQADAQRFQAESQRDAQEAAAKRAHELQLAQLKHGADLQRELLALASGVLASREAAMQAGAQAAAAGQGPNLINGTTLDQTGQAVAAASPQQLDEVIAQINRIAAAFVQPGGMGGGNG